MSDEKQRVTEQAMFQEHQVQDPHAPLGVFDLPCGYLAPNGELIKEVRVREITGAEEDMLAVRTMNGGKKMTQLIGNCLEQLGPVVDRPLLLKLARDLTIGDRVFLLFAIRRVTLGDVFPVEEKCPECQKKSNFYIDVSKLTIKAMPTPSKRVYAYTSTSGKTTAQWHVMTGKDEEALSALASSDALSGALLARLDVLNGGPPTLDTVKKLSLPERTALREEFDRHEGGVDTEAAVECGHCGHEFKVELNPGATGFFFPSRVRKA